MMNVIEKFVGTTKGDKSEDLIVETPHYFGVFDGVSGITATWLEEGKTMGQWAAILAGEALKQLPPDASVDDYAALAVKMNADARKKWGLSQADRLASGALILPRRKPLEVWVIGDSHFGYRLKDGTWKSCPQGKKYDDVVLAFRQLVITQQMLDRGFPQTQEERAAMYALVWPMYDPLNKQMLWANYPDPQEKLGFGVVTGTPIPKHHRDVFTLPEDTVEIVLASDGLPEATQTAEEGRKVIEQLHRDDPFLTGRNPLGFIGHKGGFVQKDGRIADWYDDVSYLRIAV